MKFKAGERVYVVYDGFKGFGTIKEAVHCDIFGLYYKVSDLNGFGDVREEWKEKDDYVFNSDYIFSSQKEYEGGVV